LEKLIEQATTKAKTKSDQAGNEVEWTSTVFYNGEEIKHGDKVDWPEFPILLLPVSIPDGLEEALLPYDCDLLRDKKKSGKDRNKGFLYAQCA